VLCCFVEQLDGFGDYLVVGIHEVQIASACLVYHTVAGHAGAAVLRLPQQPDAVAPGVFTSVVLHHVDGMVGAAVVYKEHFYIRKRLSQHSVKHLSDKCFSIINWNSYGYFARHHCSSLYITLNNAFMAATAIQGGMMLIA
jgi:hypothetical protein